MHSPFFLYTMIIIAGDSWACGEWLSNQIPFIPTHRGITQYLIEDGYRVCNVGVPGGSNNDILKKISTVLTVAKTAEEPIEKIFVFQTDWVRNFTLDGINLLKFTHDPESIFTALGYIYVKNSENSLVDTRKFVTNVVSHFYYQLSELATQFNVKVSIIGGCADALYLPDVSANYPGISIPCQSFTNLILKNSDVNYFPVLGLYYNSQCQDWLKTQFTKDLKGLYKELGLAQRREYEIRKSQFFPDNCHPDRHAHKTLYEFLKFKNEIPIKASL